MTPCHHAVIAGIRPTLLTGVLSGRAAGGSTTTTPVPATDPVTVIAERVTDVSLFASVASGVPRGALLNTRHGNTPTLHA